MRWIQKLQKVLDKEKMLHSKETLQKALENFPEALVIKKDAQTIFSNLSNEKMENSTLFYLDNEKIKHVFDVKVNLEVKDFNSQPFPEFKKSVNEKMDIRRSFN